jgi:hypothetical protein
LLAILIMTMHHLIRPCYCLIRDKNYFLDRCCIEQIDEGEKLKELRYIPHILDKSQELVVLLDGNYFARLWCCYEIAVYTTISRTRRDILFIPTRLVYLTMMLLVVDLIYVVLLRSGLRSIVSKESFWAFILISAGYSFLVGGLFVWFSIWWYRVIVNHKQRLKDFKLSQTNCSDQKDRQIIEADIRQRFGTIESFEKYIQTDILNEVGSLTPRLEFMWFAGVPQLSSIFGYTCILTQRIGLYCMSFLDVGYVPKDDLFCRILDRDKIQNGMIISCQIIRFVCFYPVVLSFLLKACEIINTRIKVVWRRNVVYLALFILIAAYMTLENWKFPDKYSGIVHGINGGIFLVLFSLIYITPLFRKSPPSSTH